MAHDPSLPKTRPASPGPDSTHFQPGPGSVAGTRPVSGRYEIGREIARGGMGVVYAARDTALNRDVAVKVLREDLAGRTHVARRFVEEAKIAGQLQRSGVPPVHDLGVLPDGRPFIAMKLIKGSTLAELLAGRDESGRAPGDLAALLPVFEQVCQTVAYAHSKGVIHRDLKPANVMVGAFGEVQVMDWGLAKVLASGGRESAVRTEVESRAPESVVETDRDPAAATQAGSLLGTPAYMPPEQAKGEIDRLDARADVFALGAVLCELLTGDPPYAGPTDEVPALALTAQLGPAYARLDACGADPELVALAKRCLAKDPADRPADAGEVAAAVVAHRAGVADRLRAAELAAARSEVEAAERRKRRRVQLALGLAVLVAAAAIGAGAWWRWKQAADRELERAVARQTLKTALGRAGEALREEKLPAADAALDRANDLLEPVGDAGLRDQYADLRADRALVGELDRVWTRAAAFHVPVGGGGSFRLDDEVARTGYPAAFAVRGLDLGAADAADRIAASPARDRLVAALDDWLPVAADADRPRLLAVLARVDPDPARNDIRAAHTDPSRLKTLFADPPPDSALRVAARAAMLLDDKDHRALPILLAAAARHPDDIRTLHATATRFLRTDPAAAVGYFRAIQILRPDSFAAVYGLGFALHLDRRPKEAVPHYLRAVELEPGDGLTYVNLADVLKMLRTEADVAPVVAHFEREVARTPDRAMAHFGLAMALRDKEPARAAESFRRAIALDDALALAHHYLGYVLHSLGGDPDERIRCFRRAIERDPKFAFSRYMLGVELSRKRDWVGAAASYGKAIELSPEHTYSHISLGRTLAIQNRPAEAEASYRRVIAIDPLFTEAYQELGQLLLRTGDPARAVEVFRACVQRLPHRSEGYVGLVPALRRTGANAEAVRVYQQAALSARSNWDPAVRRQMRYSAAKAAARAAAGSGTDAPGPADRIVFRRFALACLRDDLPWLEATPVRPSDRRPLHERPEFWLADPDLLTVRHPMALAFLSPDERDAWRALWAEVRKLRGAGSGGGK